MLKPLIERVGEVTVVGAILVVIVIALARGYLITVKHHAEIIEAYEKLIAELKLERDYWRNKANGLTKKDRF